MKTTNGFQPLTVFPKRCILDVLQGCEYISACGVDNKRNKSSKLTVKKTQKKQSNKEKIIWKGGIYAVWKKMLL